VGVAGPPSGAGDEVKTCVPPLDACPPTTTPDRHYGATPPTRGRAVKNPPLYRVLNAPDFPYGKGGFDVGSGAR
jgi:hypothetical protein